MKIYYSKIIYAIYCYTLIFQKSVQQKSDEIRKLCTAIDDNFTSNKLTWAYVIRLRRYFVHALSNQVPSTKQMKIHFAFTRANNKSLAKSYKCTKNHAGKCFIV